MKKGKIDLRIGMDAGGTNNSTLSTHSDKVLWTPTNSLRSLEDAVEKAFNHFGVPELLVIGAAGFVGDQNRVQLTNRPDWPEFVADEVADSFGCKIIVVNDMKAKAAGLPLSAAHPFRHGHEQPDAAKVVVSVSTGVGNAVLLPNGEVTESEGGHTTWQPANNIEMNILDALRARRNVRYFSVEQLIGGKHFLTLYDAMSESVPTRPNVTLAREVQKCRKKDEPIGPLIFQSALDGDPFCQIFMGVVGSLLGQYLRNLALLFEPTGGMYLTGGAMQPEIVSYLFERTQLEEAFLGGEMHNDWLKGIPIFLVSDPAVGVKGALQLARNASLD